MRNSFTGSISVLLIFLPLAIAGCCGPCGGKDAKKEEVIASINKYKLTASDFRDEARIVGPNLRLSSDPEKAREEVLNELITKKVMLQAAQAQNFDKDRDFMKEIERYWEQALLKLMLKKKIDEFTSRVVVTDEEAKAEYEERLKEGKRAAEPFETALPDIKRDLKDKKIRAELAAWVAVERDKARIKIYNDKLKDLSVK